jgi:hypothetical protein
MIGRLLGLGPTVEMRTADALQPGPALIHGVVTAPSNIPSPVNRTACVAFYYRASYRRPSRLKGFQQELLRDALVYAANLTLEIDGVQISLVPKRNDDFDASVHQALGQSDLDGFRGVEKTVPPGASVRALGRLKRKRDVWTLQLEELKYEPPAKKPKPAKKKKNKRRG